MPGSKAGSTRRADARVEALASCANLQIYNFLFEKEREAQLAYTDLEGVVYVVASNFGGQHHPAWSYNLQADPHAFMQLRDERIPVSAEQLSDEVKDSVWKRLCDNIPNYSTYAERTDRNIKVYGLSPRALE